MFHSPIRSLSYFQIKYCLLGVTLDPLLSMGEHVIEVVKGCNYHLHSLRYIRSSLTIEVANTVACSLILSKMDYCNSLLYGASEGVKHKLQVVQNNVARAVLRAGYRAKPDPLLQHLHWLPIKSRIDFKIATLTFKALSSDQPKYLRDLIVRETHTRPLRSDDLDRLVIPGLPLKTAKGSFAKSAPKVWNSLSVGTKQANTVQNFCGLLKTELFEKYIAGLDRT